jgi:hypothetical protein
VLSGKHEQQAARRSLLLDLVVFGESLGTGLYVEATHLDESGRLLSIRPADIFEILAESVGVIENVANSHTASQDVLLTTEDYANG